MKFEASKERWKNSYILVIFVKFGDIYPSFSEKHKGIIFYLIDLFIGVLLLFACIFGFLLCQFVEMPIRYILFKGSMTAKVKHWANVWCVFLRSFYNEI